METNNKKAESVVKFYVLCAKLKNLIRTGWKVWNVQNERLESVAEHIYGTQMLAISMKSEFNYDVDLYKVIKMLAVHELEEIIIGDITLFQMDRTQKEQLGHKAIEKILDGLVDKQELKALIFEFDDRTTKEAKFAYFCDKMEADLQARIYDLKDCVDVKKAKNNDLKDTVVNSLLSSGNSWGQMWLKFGQTKYNYDDNFLSVSNFAINNDIVKLADLEAEEK